MIEYPKYKKVLFCTDFSENSDYAFEFAYGIAKRDEGLLYILHVIPANPQQSIENGIKYEIVTKSGREDEEILKFAKDEKVDIIVVGTHGRTGIEHVFFGSVAEKVLRRSPFPLFLIPCRKKLERP
jgi:nucleotide-binding universal stress UspA family protein